MEGGRVEGGCVVDKGCERRDAAAKVFGAGWVSVGTVWRDARLSDEKRICILVGYIAKRSKRNEAHHHSHAVLAHFSSEYAKMLKEQSHTLPNGTCDEPKKGPKRDQAHHLSLLKYTVHT